ncbi:MAG: NfeD family protein [Ilumatobacter sp.]|uniref:NfeD family protein n=1 Tax=Ilumatobacter sp. TaxID=1967498 RepID=UPI002638F4CC|nr:NfeD family protein [Ilumatobacter sp.]MDJ0767217.1 NfeD family protein [Ilumatobacter sp.]
MSMFIVIGVVGAVLLLSSLLFDDLIDGLVPDLDFISGPVIGAFLAAFGLFGWFVGSGLEAPLLLAGVVAIGGGIVFGAFTFRLTMALINQPTDATPTTASLVGASGKVVTPVRADSIGEVLVLLGGASTKYTATADTDLPTGASVVVIAVESPTKVRVQAEAEFWT